MTLFNTGLSSSVHNWPSAEFKYGAENDTHVLTVLAPKASLSADDLQYWFMVTFVERISKCQSESYFKGPNAGIKTKGENYVNCKLHTINLLASELFFKILAHPVYKMWIKQEPNMNYETNSILKRNKRTVYFISFISIQPWRPGLAGTRAQSCADMALAHCILGKFLRVVCL